MMMCPRSMHNIGHQLGNGTNCNRHATSKCWIAYSTNCNAGAYGRSGNGSKGESDDETK